MPIDPSVQRKVDSMKDEMKNLRQANKDAQSAASDKLKNDLEMLKNKRQQILDAEKKRNQTLAQQSEETEVLNTELTEKAATGGFDYEKKVNDTLKSMGKAHKDSGTAGSSADAPDAKFTHNGKEHNLEIKQNSKAMYGQIELHHNGKEWDISERSKKKYPETHKAIAASGFLKKVNKQWDKPTGDYDKDLKMGNVYHDHPDAEPIKAHYGKDRKTDYIQIGGGHGFYHTGNDAAKLGSPELNGKTQFRARMKYRGTDKKTGKKKYGALVVMGLKDAEKSHHNLDNPTQKEWLEDIMHGHQLVETALNPKDIHGDYAAKSKVLQDLSREKHVDQKAVTQRRLDLDKEYAKMCKESLNESAFADGFAAGETGAMLNNPHAEKSVDWHQFQDGYYRGDAARRIKQVYESHAPEAPSIGVHRIAVTVSDPDHPMVSQRDTKLQKFVRVTHHDANKAIETGKKHFAKKGWKVHDAYHAGNVHESLEEAHKIGDKVIITKGPKDVVGKVGHVGEIRKRWVGDTKTYTIDHDAGSIQLKPTHFKKHVTESDASWAAAMEKQKQQRLTNKDQRTLVKIRDLLNREKKPVKEETTITEEHLVHVNDGSKYGDQPHDKDVEHVMAGVKKHNGEFDGHSDKGAYFKFKSHDDAKAFKKHVDSCPKHTCDADLTEGLKHHVAAAAIAVAGALGGHAHAQSAPQHDTAKPAATASAQDSDKSPHDGAPKAEHKARIDKAEAEGSMTRGDANVERMKHGLRPSFGRVRLNAESVQMEAKSTSGAYEKAQENKRSADDAKKQGDMFAHHLHMSDHHDNLAQWHSEEGRHSMSDIHAEKSEKHHEEAMKLKESVQIDEISQKLAGDYYGAATKKHLAKVGMKANMYDRIEKDMGKNRKAGVDRALDRITGARKTNEDTVQIDELSNGLLQRYKDKAMKSADELAAQGKHSKANDRYMNHMKASGKQIDTTMKKISARLNKEDVQLDEVKSDSSLDKLKSDDVFGL